MLDLQASTIGSMCVYEGDAGKFSLVHLPMIFTWASLCKRFIFVIQAMTG